MLGVSGVSGLGLFVGENIKKDGFLGEYKGEIVSNEEAERRGKLYDKRGVSFLFNLNESMYTFFPVRRVWANESKRSQLKSSMQPEQATSSVL